MSIKISLGGAGCYLSCSQGHPSNEILGALGKKAKVRLKVRQKKEHNSERSTEGGPLTKRKSRELYKVGGFTQMKKAIEHRLKILSYNIHKGFTADNSTFVLGQMRDTLRRVQPDIVFLQEVLGDHKKHRRKIVGWPESSQYEFLAEQVWPHYAYGKNAVYAGGHHGNAILSKLPITEWENLDVSSNRFERRGILHGVIPLPGLPNPLHVFCLHLNLLHWGRNKQVRVLCSRIEEKVPAECPIIIGGDFNDWYGGATKILMQSIQTQDVFHSSTRRCARTFPARKPVLPLDHIYFRGVQVTAAKLLGGKPWRSLSDHLALYCEVLY